MHGNSIPAKQGSRLLPEVIWIWGIGPAGHPEMGIELGTPVEYQKWIKDPEQNSCNVAQMS
jgi:hypothetical protein